MDIFCNSSQRYEQRKEWKTYIGWFTITAMNIPVNREIEIIFNRLKGKVHENITIIT
jgi:hypothetical protein